MMQPQFLIGTRMNKFLSLLCALSAMALLSAAATAGTTEISQVPLLNISGTGAVKPNLMLLYDNSGSMRSAFTPDYVDDTTTCRSRTLMSGGVTGCRVGHPPFNSADFNKQYYNPKVRYSPPVYAGGTSYPSLDRATTTDWTLVTTDGFGVNLTDLLGANVATTNLATGFPDLRWCDSNNACGYNTATYSFPTDNQYTAKSFTTNPYYYTINVAEYCTDASMTTCVGTTVGAPAPAGYPVPAKVRWCDSTALTRCQAKYVGSYKYPRFANPNGGLVASYGTITIDASATNGALQVSGVTVTEPGATVTITNSAVSTPTGTNGITEQATVATSLAASIIAKTGLVNQYTACVRTPTPSNSSVPACSTLGISLGANNIVAVVPIDCTPGATSKAMGPCSVVPDASRAGWPLTVSAPSVVTRAQAATALISVAGTASNNKLPELASITLGGVAMLSGPLKLASSDSATNIASKIAAAIGTRGGTVTAYVGGSTTLSDLCKNASVTTVCLINTAANAAGQGVVMGALSNNVGSGGGGKGGSVVFTTATSSAATAAQTDAIPTSSTPLGAGAAVFVRTDIVPARTSYPKDTGRTDCAGTTCTYDEEMTNFANWYGYYKTRNQMMKSAVGHAFQPITANYNVGLVSLSTAAAGGAMTRPAPFAGTQRTNWYSQLYAMNGSNSTPIRQALHSIGQMYANLAPYVAEAGAEVVQFPCQQNFTFVTTDGYWNGAAAANVVSNDNTENANRFCSRAKGCVDPATQSDNSLADVALYWYNGGSNTTVTSLRPALEDWTRPGLVPAASGENTRLHMTTYALGLGVDGVMNYEPNYDTAANVGGDFYRLITGVTTGCPWNNNGAYVWPDPKTNDNSGSAAYQSRVDDLWHAAINGHGKYFSASDPGQVVDGLRAALSNIEVKRGAAAAAATSTPNISQQDNDIFSATFTTVRWFGELSDRKIDTVTGVVGTTSVWNSSEQVGRKVAADSDSRNILMLDTAATPAKLKLFDYGKLTADEAAWFKGKCSALAQCANLSLADRAVLDDGKNIVNWLRGQQQHANDTLMRAYSMTPSTPAGLTGPLPIVLGDIASSKPAFMREPRKGYTGTDYSDFKVKVARANRTPTVFAAANDGMLHAFDAGTGEEIFAYVPRITMKKLHLQASTTYGTNHQFSVDGSPEVADVKIGADWKTVLVGGLNGGGRGYYAIDVTDPHNPGALWELCADPTVCSGPNLEPDIGLTFGSPQFGTWKDSSGVEHWVVFLTSGYNNVPDTDGVPGGDGVGYLFVVDVATGRVLQKIGTGSGKPDEPSGLARITAISANPMTDPLVTYVYGGDNLGQMWRFDFTGTGGGKVNMMASAGAAQPITTRPDVTLCQVDTLDKDGSVIKSEPEKVVVFGTGRLLALADISNTDLQSVYALKDTTQLITKDPKWRAGAWMAQQSLAKLASGGKDTYTVSGTKVDLSTQLGWFVDLDQNAGERVNLDPAIVSGSLTVVSNLPRSSSSCSVGGTSNVYQFNVCTGRAIETTNDGTGQNGSAALAGYTLSNNSAAVGFIIIRLPSGALKMIATTANGETITERRTQAVTQGARRSGWRRVRN
jgi:type IV pilus assembly protein PilY1